MPTAEDDGPGVIGDEDLVLFGDEDKPSPINRPAPQDRSKSALKSSLKVGKSMPQIMISRSQSID